jgi:hypothetical protein
MALADNNLNSTIQSLFDSNGKISINWNNRTLYDNADSNNQSISWHNRLLYDSAGNQTFNWETQTIFDANKVQCVVWKNRTLYDYQSAPTVDWNSKILPGDWNLDGIGSISASLSNALGSPVVTHYSVGNVTTSSLQLNSAQGKLSNLVAFVSVTTSGSILRLNFPEGDFDGQNLNVIIQSHENIASSSFSGPVEIGNYEPNSRGMNLFWDNNHGSWYNIV